MKECVYVCVFVCVCVYVCESMELPFVVTGNAEIERDILLVSRAYTYAVLHM